MTIADLHIHSRYSRATSKSLDPENLWVAAQLKGVDLLGSGDFTHPAWLEELAEKLVETGDGAYELRPELARELAGRVPPGCQRPVRFLLSGEISSIYKAGGKTRKIHNLILLPDLEAARRINARLDKLGNITSDGRPILGLPAKDLLELCLEVEPSVIFIPAHIWTPWFSLFGSKSGFEAIEECFGDLTCHINALETGLSSDPPMNWRLSALDRFALVSHSDAHSPAKLAREADILDCEPTYAGLAAALADPAGPGLAGTLEFFPDEGKYHLDGHRACGVRLEPKETLALGGKCPVCGRPVTVGVLNRVEELADRGPGQRPPNAKSFESLVPLAEVVSEVKQKGPATKTVAVLVDKLLAELGPELFVLREAEHDRLVEAGGELLAEAIRRMRSGEVQVEGGFDGQFGVVRLFSPAERERIKGQGGFWELAPKTAPKKAKTKVRLKKPAPPAPPLLTPLDPAKEGLNDQQRQAVEHRGGHLLVHAGPGTGKTRVMVRRALALLEEGASPESLLLITFTNKAAGELAERLAALSPRSGVKVATFHALGLEIISQALGDPPRVLGEDERLELIKPLAAGAGIKPGDLALLLTRAKQSLAGPKEREAAILLPVYEDALAQAGALDMDDLVRRTALALSEDPSLAEAWRGRFSHILVDEYQDVNPVQVDLLKALCGPQTQVAAIGDPDQAIYGFRGADRRLFMAFGRDFPGAAQTGLELNYRSNAPILEAAQALLGGDGPDLRAVKPQGPLPVACALSDARAEARWVARRIVALLGGLDSRQVEAAGGSGEGYAAREVAVLYRLHAQAGAFKEALAEAGVPFQVASREPLAETDPMDFKAQRVSLLSMHAAKGLEWPVVFVTGLEEGLLPYEPPNRPPAELEEERRLLYVALTRARERLFLTRAQKRTLFGQSRRPEASPLLAAIPQTLLNSIKPAGRDRRARQLGLFG